MTAHPSFDETTSLLEASEALLERALAAGQELTGGGKLIDDHQVVTERLAYAATEAVAARELTQAVHELRAEGRSDSALELTAVGAMGHLVSGLRSRIFQVVDELGLGDETMEEIFPADMRGLLRRASSESLYREIGLNVTNTLGANEYPLDEMHEQVRSQVREFAAAEVAPHAEHIHRNDELVPEHFITSMAELGFFGLSVPEEHQSILM